MARFSYKCNEHGLFRVNLERRKRIQDCPKCGSACRSIIKAGSVRVVERLDNGAMARTVERLHNVEEILDEVADKHGNGQPEDDNEC